MRIRPIPLALRRLELWEQSRSRYAQLLTRENALQMLQRITGQDFGYDARRWREWIRGHMTLDGRPKQPSRGE
jgi:hypothetical protein